jgi:hypothetical protein
VADIQAGNPIEFFLAHIDKRRKLLRFAPLTDVLRGINIFTE